MADNFHFQIGFLFTSLFGCFYVLQGEANVVQLDNSFTELKKSGFWFVEFYAPWCGHCKHLEPIWEQVGLELMRNSPVVTAKLDCTRFQDLAEEMGIHGFPTIKFFREGNPITYRGPRTKDALVEFARKASRPILTEFKTTEDFNKRRKQSTVFFLFVKNEKTTSEYKNTIYDVAEGKIAQVVFYSIEAANLPEDVKVEKVPSILVFKDNLVSLFEDTDTINVTAVSKWVDREKFPAFLLATESNVDELADTGKMLVLVTFGLYSEKKKINKKLGEIVKKLSIEEYEKYGRHFQFAGLLKHEISESLMMSSADHPSILVFEPESRVYYFLPSSAITESFERTDLVSFLEDVLNNKATPYGGRTFIQRMRRIWWDIRSSAQEMWTTSPVMACMIFGIPLLVITFIIVMLCCLEPVSDDDEEHEKETGEYDEGPGNIDDVTRDVGDEVTRDGGDDVTRDVGDDVTRDDTQHDVDDVKPPEDEHGHLKSD